MKQEILNEKSNKSLNSLSKAIEVICKIGKVFIIIGVVFMTLACIALGFVFSKIKIQGNEIRIKGVKDKIVFVEKDNGVALKFGDEESEILNVKMEEVSKYLKQNSVAKLSAFVELSLIAVIIYMIICYLILGRVIKIFKNTRLESPFKEENSLHIRKIAYYLIAIIIVSVVISVIGAILYDITQNNLISVPSVMSILVIFALSYIFEYGNKLENKKTSKN